MSGQRAPEKRLNSNSTEEMQNKTKMRYTTRLLERLKLILKAQQCRVLERHSGRATHGELERVMQVTHFKNTLAVEHSLTRCPRNPALRKLPQSMAC